VQNHKLDFAGIDPGFDFNEINALCKTLWELPCANKTFKYLPTAR